MTREEVRNLWVERLESGRIKQIAGVLGTVDGRRCCLGVLCDIAVEQNIIPAPESSEESPYLGYVNKAGQLPEIVCEWVGLTNEDGGFNPELDKYTSLAILNDHGSSFKEIAEVIRSKPEGLFVD